MITIEQCRAARGLLDWTQQDLADASGMSKTAINNFEKSHSDIKTESLKAIRMAFESADIEFLGDQGLRKKTEEAGILKGPNALSDLLDDIFETLKNDDGGEIMMINTGALQIDEQKLQQHAKRLKAHNITERMICSEGTQPNTDLCRWIADSDFNSVRTTFIYGSKVAFELAGRNMIVIINSHDAAQTEKMRFEYLWDKAAPTISTNPKTKKA